MCNRRRNNHKTLNDNKSSEVEEGQSQKKTKKKTTTGQQFAITATSVSPEQTVTNVQECCKPEGAKRQMNWMVGFCV